MEQSQGMSKIDRDRKICSQGDILGIHMLQLIPSLLW
jgi:hypothetical protein